MFELEILSIVAIFLAGVLLGVLATLLVNKIRTGSVSAGQIKKEKDDYQNQVEAHFEETSKKFKDMAAQYQDLYQHLSVGATTLCRPDKVAAGLSDLRDPLKSTTAIEAGKPEPVKSNIRDPLGNKPGKLNPAKHTPTSRQSAKPDSRAKTEIKKPSSNSDGAGKTPPAKPENPAKLKK